MAAAPERTDVSARCRALLAQAVEIHARLAHGEERDLDAYTVERRGIVAILEACDAPLARDDAEALGRVLDLDREIVRLLTARATGIRAKLDRIGRARRSLRGYRGGVSETARFLERLG